VCPRCGKNVFFAEQLKAVGKTFHKGCLRCTECNTTLDSSRLTEKDGEPFCYRCYGKLHGPQGGGYALLGKAGG
jgi:formylmethanofuran dehydrogenase subunit E